MIDRVKGPEINQDFEIITPQSEHYVLSNGLEVFELNASTQPIIKLDFCIKAGRIHESNRAQARATLDLMKEATISRNSNTLAEHFDFYGAEYFCSIDLDSSRVSLITLDKFLPEVIEAWIEIIFNPVFDKLDFEQYISITAQKLKSQLSKNEVIAYREFTERLFGTLHPYGYNTNPEDIKALEIERLGEYYDKNIGLDNAALFISGRISDESRKIILKHFEAQVKSSQQNTFNNSRPQLTKEIINLSVGQAHQTSIKIGGPLFERNHQDFSRMYVVNTILGGYFGSRLMTNIREDKGYCYNIYSGVDALVHDGYWYVASDVGNDMVMKTIDEIYKEIKTLQTEAMPSEELGMVKNYLQGHVMSMLDGPFASSKVVQGGWKFNLGPNYVQNFADQIRTISAEHVMELANKYYNLDEILLIKVGKSI